MFSAGNSRFRHFLFLLAALICAAEVAEAQITPADSFPKKPKDIKPEAHPKSTGSVPREEFLKPKKPVQKDSGNQIRPQTDDSLKHKQGINLQGVTLKISEPAPGQTADSFRYIVDTAASFSGGSYAHAQFIAEHFTYPQRCKDAGIESYATLLLGISKQGELLNIKVLEYDTLCPEFLTELLKVYKQPHRWKPAILKGEPVAAWLRLPMDFR